MIILSIDVGIKNLAYCLLDVSNSAAGASVDAAELDNYKILLWDSINLCGDERKCGFLKCTKTATYTHNHNKEVFFCSIHAKKSAPQYVMSHSDLIMSNLKKMKIEPLRELVHKFKLCGDDIVNITKPALLALFALFITEKCLTPIVAKSANGMNLISIGIVMKREFELRLPIQTIDLIIIENQISPIANRMKTIQGMMAQFFIMHGKNDIHFVSSANKLKAFEKNSINEDNVVVVGNEIENEKKKSTYADRKKLGIKSTIDILDNNPDCSSWSPFFTAHKKKDDLADSFLQGLWFLKQKKYTP
jgi:hypothetical protein